MHFGDRVWAVWKHVRGCADESLSEREVDDDDRLVDPPSLSPISMMASPPKVASVSVGDWGPFSISLTTVSPVMARVGAILAGQGDATGARRGKPGDRQQKNSAPRQTWRVGLRKVAQLQRKCGG